MSNDQQGENRVARALDITRTTTRLRPPNKIVHNQTARRIGIASERKDGSLFVLAPFGERTVPEEELNQFDYKPWTQQNLITVKDEVTAEAYTIETAIGCLGLVSLIGIPVGLLIPALRSSLWYWVGFGAIALSPVVIGLLSKRWHLVRQWASQSFTLVLTLAIGFGLPALVIRLFGGGQELLAPAQLRQPSLALLGRGLQLTFIAIASLLPALLYFLFDRQQLGTLRENFFRDIILLDSNVVTLEDATSIYGGRVDEVYGPEEGARGKGRFLYGTRWPILVATLVITLGWIITLLPVGPVPADLQPGDLYTLLIPRLTAVNFGFLGTYFFALNMILRRYARADLKPKAYSHITVRILVVIVLVWALSVLPQFWNNVTEGISNIRAGIVQPMQQTTTEPTPTTTVQPDAAGDEQTAAGTQPSAEESPATSPEEAGPLLLLLAFFVGIVPETGQAVIQEYLQNQQWLRDRIPSLQEEHPLTKLEGINLYDRARLLEEGIENIENLVHHDLIDLMLQTRIPLPRLVDWVDQGILYLHLVEPAETESVPAKEEGKEEKAEPPISSLQTLRRYGIRTATDLEQAYDAAAARARKKKDPKEVEHFLGILDAPDAKVKRLQVILDALTDDEWLAYVRNWRDLSRFQKETVLSPEKIR